MSIYRQNGFSMIELMVALSILAILSSAAVPSFSDWVAEKRIKAETQKIAGAFKLARMEAVAKSNQITLTWDSATGEISITNPLTNELVYQTSYDVEQILFIESDDDNSVNFSSLGRASENLDMAVCHIDGSTNDSRSLELTNVGRVTVKDNYALGLVACS